MTVSFKSADLQVSKIHNIYDAVSKEENIPFCRILVGPWCWIRLVFLPSTQPMSGWISTNLTFHQWLESWNTGYSLKKQQFAPWSDISWQWFPPIRNNITVGNLALIGLIHQLVYRFKLICTAQLKLKCLSDWIVLPCIGVKTKYMQNHQLDQAVKYMISARILLGCQISTETFPWTKLHCPFQIDKVLF